MTSPSVHPKAGRWGAVIPKHVLQPSFSLQLDEGAGALLPPLMRRCAASLLTVQVDAAIQAHLEPGSTSRCLVGTSGQQE